MCVVVTFTTHTYIEGKGMFERLAKLHELEKEEKKQSNTSTKKRAESLLRKELKEILNTYLNEQGCDSITLEIKEIDVVDFLAILQDLPAYVCEQVTETVYKFSVKSLEW